MSLHWDKISDLWYNLSISLNQGGLLLQIEWAVACDISKLQSLMPCLKILLDLKPQKLISHFFLCLNSSQYV